MCDHSSDPGVEAFVLFFYFVSMFFSTSSSLMCDATALCVCLAFSHVFFTFYFIFAFFFITSAILMCDVIALLSLGF